MRVSSFIAIAVVVGCSRDKPAPERWHELDLVAASARVRALVVDCEGLSRAIESIAASPLPARSTIGLVDEAVELGRAKCRQIELRGRRSAHAIARSKLADDAAAALRALDGAVVDAALHFHRSELLESAGRAAEALVELQRGLALEDSAPDRARMQPLQIASYAASGQVDKASALVAAAPIEARVALANRLVGVAPTTQLAALGSRGALEIASAAGDRLEREQGLPAALAARQRAAELAPDDADVLDALARALLGVGRVEDAVAAWDRAARLAPAQPIYRLAPIRALAAAGSTTLAPRIDALVVEARAGGEVEPFVTASHAAVAAGDAPRAVAILREARRRYPRDGRLAFELALRHLDANDRAAGIEVLAELLVCGAHGRPWHRHEVAGRLLQIAQDARAAVLAAVERARSCTVADAADLATYTAALRAPK